MTYKIYTKQQVFTLEEIIYLFGVDTTISLVGLETRWTIDRVKIKFIGSNIVSLYCTHYHLNRQYHFERQTKWKVISYILKI